jgi:ribokinase
MFDLVVIGDTMTDRILHITDPRILDTVDEVNHSVSLPFPIKMQLTEAPIIRAGGNALNAAKAIRKLELSTAIYTVMGKDMDAEVLMKDLRESDIDVSLVQVDRDQPSSSSYVLSFGGDRVLFSYHYPRNYSIADFPDTKYVYLTSVGENDQQLFSQVIELKKQKNFFLVFSPGTLQITEDFKEITEILKYTDLLVLNKQEAKDLSRLNSDSNENLLQGLHKMGPKTVIMTRSNHGSIAFDGTNYTKVGALEVRPVETTGAGDCYSATVTAGLARGLDLKTAMEWGALNAANLVTQVTGSSAHLKLAELQQMHAQKAGELQYVETTPKI